MFEFGPLAAQDDPDILGYFQKTKQVKKIILSEKPQKNFIFVSRPGGGKTALVKWLEGGDHGRRVISIRSDEVRMIIDDDPSVTSEDHRTLMAAELFVGILMEVKKMECLSAPLQEECTGFLSNLKWKSVEGFFKHKFEGISILGYGFS
ncbi:MAG: hypothetical protein ABSA23_10985 [Anaerolineales bacterium]